MWDDMPPEVEASFHASENEAENAWLVDAEWDDESQADL